MAQTVTLKDIARKTNLSIASVSKALAGYPHVSQATQARVRAASNKLNYRPRAQRNSHRIKHCVKCLATEDWVMQSGQWLAALAMASRSCGVRLEVSLVSEMTASSQSSQTDKNLHEDWHKTITEQSEQANGLLFFGCLDAAELQAVESMNLPCVVVGDMPVQGISMSVPIHSITTNKIAMAQFATQTLIKRGHKRIGFFCGKYPKGGWNEQWLHGYQMALRDAGIKPQAQDCKIIDTPKHNEIGNMAARAIASHPDMPTAFVTPSIRGAACFAQTMLTLGHTFGTKQLAMGGRRDDAFALDMQDVLLLEEPVEEMAIHAISLLSRVIVDNTLPPSQVLVSYRSHNFNV